MSFVSDARAFLCVALFLAPFANASTWTDYKKVSTIQTYGGASFQVWLDGLACPNSKPYFSVDPVQISGSDNLLSMVLMAKASQARIRFLIDTESNPTFCYVKGIQLE